MTAAAAPTETGGGNHDRKKTLWWVDLCTITVDAASREEAIEEGIRRIREGEATIDTVVDTGEEAKE